MASAWQSLEEAALTLGVSSRTLHRRISKGEVQTRLEQGRREVLVEIPDPVVTDEMLAGEEVSPTEPSHVSHASDVSDRYTTQAAHETALSDDVRQTMITLHEDRLRRTDLAILAYQQSVNVAAAEARRSRFNVRIAWSLAAALAVGLFLSVLWLTHDLTSVRAEVGHLTGTVQTLSVKADEKTKEADALRDEATDARLAAARAEGELVATRRQLDETAAEKARLNEQLRAASAARELGSSMPAPTTRPVILMDRIADLLSAEQR